MSICYEHPLNERIRMFLRLDHLFQQFDYAAASRSNWDSRFALVTLFDLLELLQRNELKAEIIKELDRHNQVLKRLQDSPGVDNEALTAAQNEIKRVAEQMQSFSSLVLDSYRQQDFLTAIRQRSSIPGGTCAFDLPELYYWLEHFEPSQRAQDLSLWLQALQPLQEGIRLILKLLRGSSVPRRHVANGGLYQQVLDNTPGPVQLLRLMLAVEYPVFPEISGNQHRFVVRFLKLQNPRQKAELCTEDIEFTLACCAL